MRPPGPVTSAMSVGCHELLRKHPGARLVAGLPHVLEEIGRIGEHLADPPRGPEHRRDSLDEEAGLILEAVPRRGTAAPEQLAAKAGVSLRTVLRRLSLLELPAYRPPRREIACHRMEAAAIILRSLPFLVVRSPRLDVLGRPDLPGRGPPPAGPVVTVLICTHAPAAPTRRMRSHAARSNRLHPTNHRSRDYCLLSTAIRQYRSATKCSHDTVPDNPPVPIPNTPQLAKPLASLSCA